MKRKNSDVKFIGKKIKMEPNSGRQQHLSWEINWCQDNSCFLNYSKKELINFTLSWYITILKETTKRNKFVTFILVKRKENGIRKNPKRWQRKKPVRQDKNNPKR